MSAQPDLFDQARARRDLGMQRAADHASRVEPEWIDRAFTFLSDFARTHGEFLSEDVVAAASTADFPEPPDRRAWGHVVNRASRAGLIRRVGAKPARTSNCSLKPVWVLS